MHNGRPGQRLDLAHAQNKPSPGAATATVTATRIHLLPAPVQSRNLAGGLTVEGEKATGNLPVPDAAGGLSQARLSLR